MKAADYIYAETCLQQAEQVFLRSLGFGPKDHAIQEKIRRVLMKVTAERIRAEVEERGAPIGLISVRR